MFPELYSQNFGLANSPALKINAQAVGSSSCFNIEENHRAKFSADDSLPTHNAAQQQLVFGEYFRL